MGPPGRGAPCGAAPGGPAAATPAAGADAEGSEFLLAAGAGEEQRGMDSSTSAVLQGAARARSRLLADSSSDEGEGGGGRDAAARAGGERPVGRRGRACVGIAVLPVSNGADVCGHRYGSLLLGTPCGSGGST